MAKIRQADQTCVKHIPGSSAPSKTLRPSIQGRDDSPVSVITHSAIISQPSSACTSMEHPIYHDSKLQSYQDHGYPTSHVDTFYSC
eukprot:c30084_g1_i1 orf=150-407(+)